MEEKLGVQVGDRICLPEWKNDPSMVDYIDVEYVTSTRVYFNNPHLDEECFSIEEDWTYYQAPKELKLEHHQKFLICQGGICSVGYVKSKEDAPAGLEVYTEEEAELEGFDWIF